MLIEIAKPLLRRVHRLVVGPYTVGLHIYICPNRILPTRNHCMVVCFHVVRLSAGGDLRLPQYSDWSRCQQFLAGHGTLIGFSLQACNHLIFSTIYIYIHINLRRSRDCILLCSVGGCLCIYQIVASFRSVWAAVR